MISGEWLDNKKVSEVNWWHNVDIIIPKEVKTSSGIMFIDSGVSSENYFRLDDEVINYLLIFDELLSMFDIFVKS